MAIKAIINSELGLNPNDSSGKWEKGVNYAQTPAELVVEMANRGEISEADARNYIATQAPYVAEIREI